MRLHHLELKGQNGQFVQALPATFKVRGSRTNATIAFTGAAILAGEVGGSLAQNFTFDLLSAGKLAFLFFCLTIVILAVDQFFVEGTLVVTSTEVSFDRKSLLYHRSWVEPIGNYDGILVKWVSKDIGGGVRRSKWQMWLQHKTRRKRVKLLECSASDYLDEDAARYSGLFGLPVIRK